MKTSFVFCFVFIFSLLGAFPARASDFSLGFFSSKEIRNIFQDIVLQVEDASYPVSSQEVSKWIRINDSLLYNPSYSSEIENTQFCQYKKSLVCALSFLAKDEGNIQKKALVLMDNEAVSFFPSQFSEKNDRPAENARFKMENGKVTAFSPGKDGIRIDQEKSLFLLKDFFQRKLGFLEDTRIDLAYDVLSPETTLGSIDSLGIKTLIGEGRSNFSGSPKNRIANIKVATDRFNGIIIKPQEEFSFVQNLGPVDKEHGYLPELVIKKDRTEPEFGGGICQVSTTAFRAAIYSGLKITQRTNHAYPVSYYAPQGMDSTVYVPRPDLRFINDTPGHILIQTKIEGNELIFDFYGTSDERKTNVVGPVVLEKNGDGSMKTTFTQEVFDKNGNVIRKDVFNSKYGSPSRYPHPAPEKPVLEKKTKR